ncbi:MAG: hypothetical protein QE271_07735 [Bacteriovoracaceae bacterium]|nr:hypothetical protein [Bacteriovoracaceae bacterium]
MKRFFLVVLISFITTNSVRANVVNKDKLDPNDTINNDFFDSPDLSKILNQIKKMRQEMMKDFGDKSLFKDFEDLRSSLGKSESSFFQAFSLDSDASSGNLYDMKWRNEKKGRVLEIRPKDKKTELKIEVKGGYITIKGEQKIGGVQRFEYTQNVPADLDQSNSKIAQKDGAIEVSFPWKEQNNQPSIEKKSIQDKVPLFESDKEDVI